jgi:hypothetical protein
MGRKQGDCHLCEMANRGPKGWAFQSDNRLSDVPVPVRGCWKGPKTPRNRGAVRVFIGRTVFIVRIEMACEERPSLGK